MFQILAVTLTNFRSYRQQTFTLPTQPGLYYLTGDNQMEPALGSNGAGKSTLLDAIYWCLYGRTLRGLRANDVVTWGESGAAVCVRLVVRDTTSEVKRTQNPNSLTVNDNPCSQETLTEHIGLNADAFARTVVQPQFGRSFFELSPTEKLGLFSQVMNLDFWLKKSELAATSVAAVDSEINAITAEITASRALITAHAAEITQLEAQAKTAEAEKARQRQRLKAEVEKLLTAAEHTDLNLHKLMQGYNRKLSELASVEQAKDQYITKREELTSECAVLQSKADALEATFAELAGLKGTCPVCGQRVNSQHLQAEKRRMQLLMADVEAKRDVAETRREENSKFISKVSKDAVLLDSCVKKLDDERHRLANSLTSLEQQVDAANQQLEATLQPSPYAELLAKKQAAKKQVMDKLVEQKRELTDLQAWHARTSFWVNGFKRVRLFIIEETLRTLEVEVNNNLANLGLVDWQVAFDVERENKAGGVTKGFTVFIRCPWNKEPVKLEAWSGGELQRLLLAGDMGLANLIMAQAGLSNTIQFYDEPSDHLSDEGLIDLAETLNECALRDGKSLFLIDHRNVDFGGFAKTYRVTKTKKGSSIC